MPEKKLPIEVLVEDDNIAVRCCGGNWHIGETDNRWLWVLSSIAFPGEYSIKITDNRKNREDHQPDMTTQEGRE